MKQHLSMPCQLDRVVYTLAAPYCISMLQNIADDGVIFAHNGVFQVSKRRLALVHALIDYLSNSSSSLESLVNYCMKDSQKYHIEEIEQLVYELTDIGIFRSSWYSDYQSLKHHLATNLMVCRESLQERKDNVNSKKTLRLPPGSHHKPKRRPSVRNFSGDPLSLNQVSSLLKGGYGISKTPYRSDMRPVPSAGGIYGVNIFVYAQNVYGLSRDLYLYIPEHHALQPAEHAIDPIIDIGLFFATKHIDYDRISFIFFFTADTSSYCLRYGDRGYRFILLEIGHIAQSILLEASCLNIESVCIGGHIEEKLAAFIQQAFPGRWRSIFYSMSFGN